MNPAQPPHPNAPQDKPSPQDTHAAALSDADRALLNFANTAPINSGVREEAIRQQLRLSPARYYQKLNALVDKPAAWEEFPLVLARIQRLRERPAGGS